MWAMASKSQSTRSNPCACMSCKVRAQRQEEAKPEIRQSSPTNVWEVKYGAQGGACAACVSSSACVGGRHKAMSQGITQVVRQEGKGCLFTVLQGMWEVGVRWEGRQGAGKQVRGHGLGAQGGGTGNGRRHGGR